MKIPSIILHVFQPLNRLLLPCSPHYNQTATGPCPLMLFLYKSYKMKHCSCLLPFINKTHNCRYQNIGAFFVFLPLNTDYVYKQQITRLKPCWDLNEDNLVRATRQIWYISSKLQNLCLFFPSDRRRGLALKVQNPASAQPSGGKAKPSMPVDLWH